MPVIETGRVTRNDDDIKSALRIIVSSDYVKRDPEAIYRGYVDNIRKINTTLKPLCRSVFLSILDMATKRQQHRKSAVDYVLGALCYDTMDLLREIATDHVEVGQGRNLIIAQVNAIEEFLKFTYMEHIGKDNDGFHDVSHALNQSTGESRSASFTECLSPFAVMDQLASHPQVCLTRQDAVNAISECKKKVQLFMAHQIRVSVQKKRILEVQSIVQADPAVQSVLLLMGFKMKFEPILYREKTVEFFRERGLSWHGVVAFYSDGAGVMRHLYIDQVIGNDSKQDRLAVLSLYDASLARLKLEIPTVRRVYVLSDNARCYQNNLLPSMLPFITKTH